MHSSTNFRSFHHMATVTGFESVMFGYHMATVISLQSAILEYMTELWI